MSRRRGFGILATVITAAAGAIAAPAAQAAITVNTTADPGVPGQCSLRKAIEAANTQAPAGDCAAADPSSSTTTINVPAGHYTLASQLEITGSARVLVQGANSGDPSQTVIDGAQQDRVLMVDSGANASLDGLTVTGGKTADGAPGGCCRATEFNPHSGNPGTAGGDGGGIYNSGTLTLSNALITGNSTGHGGDGGTGGAGDPTNWNGGPGGDGAFGGNGGGIFNDFFATLTLLNTTVSDNHTGAGGLGGLGGKGGTSPPPSPCPSPCGGVNGSSGGAGGAGGAGGFGGGIEDHGAQLVLADTTVSANTTGQGGDAGGGGLGADGIAGDPATPGGGGAGGGSGGGDPNVRAGSGGLGGGIDDRGRSLTITLSTISANVTGNGGNGANGGNAGNGVGADGGQGGAPSKGGGGGTGGGINLDVNTGLSISNSTFEGNHTGAGGNGGNGGNGGLGSRRGPGDPGGDAGPGGSGGAIFTNGGTLTNVTIADNQTAVGGFGGVPGEGCQPNCVISGFQPSGSDGTPGRGGGILQNGSPGISLANTLLASNQVPGGVQNCANSSGVAIGDGGHNLSFPDTSCPGTNGNPVLGPLQNNGGPTQTMALGSGSAAVDQIPVAGAGCPAADQRGVARPFPAGGACDIGAFEAALPQHTLTITTSGGGSGTVTGPGIDCGGGPAHTTCSTTVAEGTQITLSATPASGSKFGTFNGGGCGAASPCTVTMNADATVDARFDKPPPPAPTPPGPPPPPPPAGAGGGTGSGTGSGAGPSATTTAKGSIGHPKVSGITVSIPVTCTGPAGATCSVTAVLSIIEKRRGSNLIVVKAAKSPRLKTRLVTLGSTRVVIGAGQTRTVRLSLNSIGRRLLTTRQVVKAKLTVLQSGRAISTSIISFNHNVRKRR